MMVKEGSSSGKCSSSARGGVHLAGWSKKRKRTTRVAIPGCPNSTSTEKGEEWDELLIAAKTLLLLHEGPMTGGASTAAAAADEEVKMRRRRPEKRVMLSSSHSVPLLPVNFHARIRELTGGCPEDLKFIFEKKLFKSDIDKGQNRFLIPLKQIKNEFLKEDEKQELNRSLSKGCSKIEVILIQPSLEVCSINLKKWCMGDRSTAKLNENYVLVTTWHKVVIENELTVGTFVQLWSFRKDGELCFALVRKTL